MAKGYVKLFEEYISSLNENNKENIQKKISELKQQKIELEKQKVEVELNQEDVNKQISKLEETIEQLETENTSIYSDYKTAIDMLGDVQKSEENNDFDISSAYEQNDIKGSDKAKVMKYFDTGKKVKEYKQKLKKLQEQQKPLDAKLSELNTNITRTNDEISTWEGKLDKSFPQS